MLAPASVAGKPATTTAVAPDLVQKHTSADMAAAQRVLPALVDFGPGWTAAPTSGAEATLTCPDSQPLLPGVVETGAASSPTFESSTTGPFVSASAWVYRSADDAATVWQKAVGPGVLRCFVRSVEHGSTSAVKFTVGSAGPLALPRLAERAAAYRVVATARTAGQSIATYYVLVVLGQGREIAELTLARFTTPVSRDAELALARTIARRLGSS